MVAQHHDVPPEVTPGEATDCADNDCEDATTCLGCGEPICPLHSPAFSLSECVEGGWHHQDECENTCPACDAQAAEDYWSERADQRRKGEDYE